MKKLATSLLAMLLLQTGISFGKMNAYFSYALFDQPGKGPYLETYLNISGSSVKLGLNEKNKWQAQLEVQWVIRQGDKIVHFDKYNLHGPELDSTTGRIPDFVDQQRTSIDTGTYELELKISDKNTLDPAFTTKQPVSVHFPVNDVSLSDIELVESYTAASKAGNFTKSGYDLVPYVMGYYPKEMKSLKFYAEVYRTKSLLQGDYLLRYFITNSNNNQLLNDYAGSKVQSPQDVNVILGEIPIEHLATGNYFLTLEVISREHKFIAYKRTFFQRSNLENKPLLANEFSDVDVNNTFASRITSPDTLKEYLACLYPISSKLQAQIADNQIQLGDVRSMQQYLFYFWSLRDPANPESAWNAYQLEVQKVENAYHTRNRKGYDTDRGRVYLQYGPPNIVSEDKADPNAYPYEIWQYYKLDNQSNRKFVFYSNDLSTNDYRLLHSDARGELQDPAWELKLHSRSQQFGGDMDQEKAYDIYGSKTKENFSNPH